MVWILKFDQFNNLQLGGKMPLPKNISDLKKLILSVNSTEFQYLCDASFWIPLKKITNSKSMWQSLSSDVILDTRDLPWAEYEPSGEYLQQKCVYASDAFYSANCNGKGCSICQFEEERIFKLKGLCSDQAIVDTDYIYVSDENNQSHIMFRGLLGRTNLVLKQNSSNWDMIKTQMTEGINETIGNFNTSKKFPLGTHTWNLNFHCQKMMPNSSSVDLKLTKVR
jgi:hypothetical protein